MKKLKGKNCLLTGAASGIGRSLAILLAKEGMNLFVVDIDTDNLEKVNGTTNKTSQTDSPYLYGVLDRFRFYRKAGRRVAFSDQRYFEFDQVAWRFIIANVQGIPTNSLSSFVAVTGITEAAVA